MSDDVTVHLIRHGQSRANTREENPQERGDHRIGLTDEGRVQADAAGRLVGADVLKSSLTFLSPYRRTRETFEHVLLGAGIDASMLRHPPYEDPRLREVEHGYEDVAQQGVRREAHGWFYYRFHGGESPADCYDRVSGFIESLWRQVERKETYDVVLVTHGLTIRCFVMRWLHLTVEDFERMANPKNAAVITLRRRLDERTTPFMNRRWLVEGLEERDESMPFT